MVVVVVVVALEVVVVLELGIVGLVGILRALLLTPPSPSPPTLPCSIHADLMLLTAALWPLERQNRFCLHAIGTRTPDKTMLYGIVSARIVRTHQYPRYP